MPTTRSQVSHRPQWWRSLAFGLDVTTSLGSGSFAPSSYKNHYTAQAYEFAISYKLPLDFVIGASWGFDVEYTLPDNSSGRRFFARDVGLSLVWKNTHKPISKLFDFELSTGLYLPSSLAAQVATRILHFEHGLSVTRAIGPISISYRFGVNWYLHRYTTPIFVQPDHALPSIFLRQSMSDSSGLGLSEYPIPEARNTAWQVSNTFALAAKLPLKLEIGISFAIINAFRYALPDDQYTAVFITSSGPMKAKAVGRNDLTVGNIYLSWTPLKYLSLAIGVYSSQPPINADNSGLKFPFFNFATPNDNYTSFYLKISGSYS
jgi:hypothetical protein